MSRRRRPEEGLGCEGCAAEPGTAPALLLQAIALAKRPHIVVGTPGRVVDHLSNTKGFSLKVRRAAVGRGGVLGCGRLKVVAAACAAGEMVRVGPGPSSSCPASRHHPMCKRHPCPPLPRRACATWCWTRRTAC